MHKVLISLLVIGALIILGVKIGYLSPNGEYVCKNNEYVAYKYTSGIYKNWTVEFIRTATYDNEDDRDENLSVLYPFEPDDSCIYGKWLYNNKEPIYKDYLNINQYKALYKMYSMLYVFLVLLYFANLIISKILK